ncbi:hypothetical protein QFC21_000017 [Naganishia friedmannii]|uniref:Uncharacterized protein n=1 Tax=Naganishia friedmannii TaxID=89922 RepID=A0ACC2WAN2_9TREE|nr:hypothetical protein QFC21_000017 [Naganishia friedmannii]
MESDLKTSAFASADPDNFDQDRKEESSATTEIIARDEKLTNGANAIWIISASAMAFAACMPLGGRLADVTPPHWWFVVGCLGMSGFALGNSFA